MRLYAAPLLALVLAAGCSTENDPPAQPTITTSVAPPPVPVIQSTETTLPRKDIAVIIDPDNPTTVTIIPGALNSAHEPAIRALFEKFFTHDPSVPIEERVAQVTNGDQYAETIASISSSGDLAGLRSDVINIDVLTAAECEAPIGNPEVLCAMVTHRLFLGDAPLSPIYDSYAVLRDDSWLLTNLSYCEIVTSYGRACQPVH